jgi:glycogen debranching enzyme
LGSEEFTSDDPEFARRLAWAAGTLKVKFNDKKYGFLLDDATYFAQAIDGRGNQLPQQSADAAMCLWAYYQDDSVIEIPYVDRVIERITRPAMFNPAAGVRNYAEGTEFHQGTRYHGSSHTYWPFVSGVIARGLVHFGYDGHAAEIINAYLLAVKHFQSNIEMFIETSDHRLAPWHHPELEQQSAIQQAWTAAAVYYGSLYLLHKQRGYDLPH